MVITEVTVKYAATQSTADYSNVRPELQLTAQVAADEDAEDVYRSLMDEARTFVHGEIDDALEACGKAPRYYEGPRFQVVELYKSNVITVLPNEQQPPDHFHHVYGLERGLRLAAALRHAQQRASERAMVFFDCSDGDLSRIPEPLPFD